MERTRAVDAAAQHGGKDCSAQDSSVCVALGQAATLLFERRVEKSRRHNRRFLHHRFWSIKALLVATAGADLSKVSKLANQHLT